MLKKGKLGRHLATTLILLLALALTAGITWLSAKLIIPTLQDDSEPESGAIAVSIVTDFSASATSMPLPVR